MSNIIKKTSNIGIGNNYLSGLSTPSYNTFMKNSSKKIEGDLGKITKQANTLNGTKSSFGQKLGSFATGAFGDLMNTVSNFMPQNGGEDSAAIKGLSKQALNLIPGVGSVIGVADSVTGIISGISGKTLSGETTGDKIISSVPVVGNIASLFSSKLDDKNFDLSKVSSEYSTNKEQAADKLGGKTVLFGANKLKNKISDAWNMYNQKIDITEKGKKRLNNNVSDLYNSQNLFKYSGGQGSLSLAGKNGLKFPELEEARKLISYWSIKSSEKQEPQKFQLGGKMNLIPEGALHARKHNLEKVNPELEGQITSKGIPVVAQGEGGVIQQAEIEKEEVVFRKEFTDKLENLYRQYQENSSDDIAIEAGKLICYELLKNTDDRSGLIKNIK